MQTLELHPLIGIGRVKLGASSAEVHSVLGEPESRWNQTEYFCQSSIQVTYSESELVEFVECASNVHVTWNQVEIFSTPAEALIETISKFSAPAAEEDEPGYVYTFPSAEVAFWRPTIPDARNSEDGKYFESVGVGRKGYFSEAT